MSLADTAQTTMKQTNNHGINVTALGLEEEALEASYWHKGLCKLIDGDLYVDPEDFHLLLEDPYDDKHT